jgi:hypothetical protein
LENGIWDRGGPTGPDWNGQLRPGPLETGFDTCLLLPTTNDRVPQVYVADHEVENLDPDDPLWVGDRAPSADHPTGISNRESLRMNWSSGHNGTIHNGISRIGFYSDGRKARFRDEELADRWVDRSVRLMEASDQQPFFLFFRPTIFMFRECHTNDFRERRHLGIVAMRSGNWTGLWAICWVPLTGWASLKTRWSFFVPVTVPSSMTAMPTVPSKKAETIVLPDPFPAANTAFMRVEREFPSLPDGRQGFSRQQVMKSCARLIWRPAWRR